MGGPRASADVPVLLVDGHNLLWAATFGFPAAIHSRDRTRVLTGLFGFFALLRVTIRDITADGPPEVVVVFDGQHGTAARRAAHPAYKAHRPAGAAAMAPLQFLPDVKRGLDLHRISWVEVHDAEADDVIATIVTATPGPRPVLIMSRDRDFYQLLDDDRVQVLNRTMPPGRRLIDTAAVLARHRVTPAQWCDFRALTGDPADNIPGVRGIGATTAAALLAGGLTLDELPASGRLETGRGRLVRDQLEVALTWREMIRLNRRLDVAVAVSGRPSRDLPRPADVIASLGLW